MARRRNELPIHYEQPPGTGLRKKERSLPAGTGGSLEGSRLTGILPYLPTPSP